MPLMRCKVKNKSGWKWGKSGKCYTGPLARSKAKRQMRAIKASQAKRKSK